MSAEGLSDRQLGQRMAGLIASLFADTESRADGLVGVDLVSAIRTAMLDLDLGQMTLGAMYAANVAVGIPTRSGMAVEDSAAMARQVLDACAAAGDGGLPAQGFTDARVLLDAIIQSRRSGSAVAVGELLPSGMAGAGLAAIGLLWGLVKMLAAITGMTPAEAGQRLAAELAD